MCAGLACYLIIRYNMKKALGGDSPGLDLVIAISSYGGLLGVILTGLFWEPSGAMALGSLYLIVAAPVLMGFVGFRNRKRMAVSPYHFGLYVAGMLYVPALICAFLITYLATLLREG